MRCRGCIALCLVFCLVSTAAGQESPGLDALFRQAAEREHQDVAVAARLYEQAARQGHTLSMVRLGYLRQAGTGIPQDLPGALDLFTQAAKAGNLDGEFLLAMSYAQGIGTEKNPVAARKWFLQPAAAGYQFAQYALGIMLEAGEGGQRKVAAARRWLDRAASGPDAALAARAAGLRDKVDKNLFAVDDSGTALLGLIFFMALAGSALGDGSGGGSSAESNQSGSGLPRGGSTSTPKVIHCHPESNFGSAILHGKALVMPPPSTHMVCE